MKDNPKTSGPQGSDTASTSEQSPYVVMELLPPERQEWLRQQSLNVAEFYRRAAAAETSQPSAFSDEKGPNAETRRAMAELDQGKGQRSPDPAALFRALGI
jgi:hypothetical protein